MSIKTYNPIGEVHNQEPTIKAGTKLVAMKDGTWVEGNVPHEPILKKPEVINDWKALSVIGLILISLVYVLGFSVFLFIIAVAVGAVSFLKIQRTHPVSILVLGAPTQFHLVDMSPHTLKTEHSVQLGETINKVKVILQFRVNVTNAIGAVQEGITDAQAAIDQKLFRLIQEVAKNASFNDQLKSFRETLRKFSEAGFSDDVFRLSDMTFELLIDPETQKWLEDIAKAEIKKQARDVEFQDYLHKTETETRKIQASIDVRKANEDIADYERKQLDKIFETEMDLRKELLRPGANREGILNELNYRIQTGKQSFEKKLEFLRLMIKEGLIEEHEIQTKYPGFSEALLAEVTQGLTDDVSTETGQISTSTTSHLEDKNDTIKNK